MYVINKNMFLIVHTIHECVNNMVYHECMGNTITWASVLMNGKHLWMIITCIPIYG